MIAEQEIVSYKKIRHINAFLINISHRTYHTHDDFEIFAVIGGSAVVRLLSSEHKVGAGSVLIFNSGEAHEIDALGGDVRAVVIQTSPHFMREYIINTPRIHFLNQSINSLLNAAELRELISLICSTAVCYMQGKPFYEYQCIEGLMHILRILTSKVPNRLINSQEHMHHVNKERRMEAITEYIDANYQFGVRLEDLSEVFHMSAGYLSHFFTESFGIGFQEYLNNIRFDHALRLISKPDITLSDISSTCGFSDPKYMTRIFLKKLGCTPREYRQQLSQYRSKVSSLPSTQPMQFYYSEAEAIELIESSRRVAIN